MNSLLCIGVPLTVLLGSLIGIGLVWSIQEFIDWYDYGGEVDNDDNS